MEGKPEENILVSCLRNTLVKLEQKEKLAKKSNFYVKTLRLFTLSWFINGSMTRVPLSWWVMTGEFDTLQAKIRYVLWLVAFITEGLFWNRREHLFLFPEYILLFKKTEENEHSVQTVSPGLLIFKVFFFPDIFNRCSQLSQTVLWKLSVLFDVLFSGNKDRSFFFYYDYHSIISNLIIYISCNINSFSSTCLLVKIILLHFSLRLVTRTSKRSLTLTYAPLSKSQYPAKKS